LIYIFYKAFDQKPGLVINEKGITDNSNFTSVGLIEWSQIKGIRMAQVMSNRFVLIDVVNPEKYLQESSKFKASLMKSNLKIYGTPITITSNSLRCNFNELEKLLQEALSKYERDSNLNSL